MPTAGLLWGLDRRAHAGGALRKGLMCSQVNGKTSLGFNPQTKEPQHSVRYWAPAYSSCLLQVTSQGSPQVKWPGLHSSVASQDEKENTAVWMGLGRPPWCRSGKHLAERAAHMRKTVPSVAMVPKRSSWGVGHQGHLNCYRPYRASPFCHRGACSWCQGCISLSCPRGPRNARD